MNFLYDDENPFVLQMSNVRITKREIKILQNKIHTAEHWLEQRQKTCTHPVIVHYPNNKACAKEIQSESNTDSPRNSSPLVLFISISSAERQHETVSPSHEEYYRPLCGQTDFLIIPFVDGEHLIVEEPKNSNTNPDTSKERVVEIYEQVLRKSNTLLYVTEELIKLLDKEGISYHKAILG